MLLAVFELYLTPNIYHIRRDSLDFQPLLRKGSRDIRLGSREAVKKENVLKATLTGKYNGVSSFTSVRETRILELYP